MRKDKPSAPGGFLPVALPPDQDGNSMDSSLDSKPKKGIIFEICSEDGFHIRCESIEGERKHLRLCYLSSVSVLVHFMSCFFRGGFLKPTWVQRERHFFCKYLELKNIFYFFSPMLFGVTMVKLCCYWKTNKYKPTFIECISGLDRHLLFDPCIFRLHFLLQ